MPHPIRVLLARLSWTVFGALSLVMLALVIPTACDRRAPAQIDPYTEPLPFYQPTYLSPAEQHRHDADVQLAVESGLALEVTLLVGSLKLSDWAKRPRPEQGPEATL